MIFKKINNQLLKLKKYFSKYQLYKFNKGLKSCGNSVYIEFPVKFEGKEFISIGNNVSINSFVHIWGHGGVVIGDNTLIASHVSIVSVTHDTNAEIYRESLIEKKVTIGKNVWIGTHSVILPGVIINDNAVIGAGSVVTKDVPPNVVVAGVPAKIIKYKQ